VSGSPIILLVEDNPDDVALTARAFQKSKIAADLVIATDGEEALDYLFATGRYAQRGQIVLPTVVLLDLKLPKVDGLEVLEKIRGNERTRRLPVVVLTSSNEDNDVLGSYDRGANSFVRKPVDFSEFVDAAKTLGFYWLVLNENPASHGEST
jgi:two-component system, response regulator